jgi:methionine biosynthesis protein MetW
MPKRSFRPPPTCRSDHWLICQLVDPDSRVLDLGCGSGELLQLLATEKNVEGTGVEVSEEKVYECVSRGLSVHHGDIDEGLSDFPDEWFDYVILSQTLQEIRRPSLVIREMLRVGKRGIVSFPNFAHWRARWQLLVHGTTPTVSAYPHEWYETPNVQFLSIKDFQRLCTKERFGIVHSVFLPRRGLIEFVPNLLAETAIFVLMKASRV